MTTGLYTPRKPLPILSIAATAAKSLGALVARYWRAWRHRREMRELLSWDERALKDIGLTSMDVRLANALPSGIDPTSQLRVYAVERRAADRARAQERLRMIKSLEAASRANAAKRNCAERSAEMQDGKLLEFKRYHL